MHVLYVSDNHVPIAEFKVLYHMVIIIMVGAWLSWSLTSVKYVLTYCYDYLWLSLVSHLCSSLSPSWLWMELPSDKIDGVYWT